jgi:endonuclease/exonuclease/phosphatase family metal-dependent hydrolase
MFVTNAKSADTIRVATYNVSLYGEKAGEVASRLEAGDDRQATRLAEVIQHVRPDVLLLNEVDYDPNRRTLDLFADRYLAIDRDHAKGIAYPFRYSAASNTGVDSKLDLNLNGKLGEPNDAWGYGKYEGQYGMAILSRFPIDETKIRSFQQYLWSSLPNALQPRDPQTGTPYYSESVWNQLRLSSKNHLDVPIHIRDRTLHVLASHPTPPVFDGPEDRNGCRNHDEIRFWDDYLSGNSAHLTDDAGIKGGLAPEAMFVVAGDLNSDGVAGDSRHEAIVRLTNHARVQDPLPKQDSSSESRSMSTAAFGGPNGLRVDYVLPSRNLSVRQSGVFWPPKSDPQYQWIVATDHRMVWVDLEFPD